MNSMQICEQIVKRLDEKHTRVLYGYDKPLLLISDEYNGIWLEHLYDSVFYATLDRSKLYLAVNAVEAFMSLQKSDGQLPYAIKDSDIPDRPFAGFYQIQECVSFARLALLVYEMNCDAEFLTRIYRASRKWAEWLRDNRMTTGRGLVEMFVGFDTGHDRSSRLSGMLCRGGYVKDGVRMEASVIPPCPVAPVIAVDMNCNYYSTLISLSKMAKILKLHEESDSWMAGAREVKRKLFELCFDKEDCFFYDLDKNGSKRKYLSSTIFHLFMEGVLDKKEDAGLIKELYDRHISNPNEFATPYPYPSMAVCDPSTRGHELANCWGYYSQGLIALRATLWMEEYGFSAELDNLSKKWLEAWTRCFDKFKLGQELDPITGDPTPCSEWYSSTMLFYLYATKRILKSQHTHKGEDHG